MAKTTARKKKAEEPAPYAAPHVRYVELASNAERTLLARNVNHDPCRGGKCCDADPCDNCKAWAELIKIEHERNERYADALREFNALAATYPEEMTDILTPLLIRVYQRLKGSLN